jgi:uncharacterized integral membrane protein (TIGR00698 family)
VVAGASGTSVSDIGTLAPRHDRTDRLSSVILPSARHRSWDVVRVGAGMDQTGPVRRLLPGMLVAALAATVSLLAAGRVTAVSPLIIAIVLGIGAHNLRLLPASTLPGIGWTAKRVLRAGVVLLGLQLSVPAVLELGAGGLAVILVTVTLTFASTLVIGRLLRVPRTMSLLVATGFAICGAAAIAAMSAVVDPRGEHEEDTATSIALVTLFGTVALVSLPVLVALLGLDDRDAGLWIGASVHEVAQVVAAGGAVSAAALAVATVTKLGRVVLLAPLVAGAGLVLRRRAVLEGSAVAGLGHRGAPPVLPLFGAGFLLAVLVRSSALLPDAALGLAQTVTTALLTAAMFGLGAGVDLRVLVRTGGRATALGAASTLVAGGVALTTILLVG